MIAFAETNARDVVSERPFEDRLEEPVRGEFNYDCVFRDFSYGVSKQDRRRDVIYVVLHGRQFGKRLSQTILWN